jgi:uncharacterized protein (DUF58 family)
LKPRHFIKDLFFTNRFFFCWGNLALVFIATFFLPWMMIIAKGMLAFFAILTLIDFAILFLTSHQIIASRKVNDLLSNAEDNIVKLSIQSSYKIPLLVSIIDELPFQFQKRDFLISKKLLPQLSIECQYLIRPFQRGEYQFGDIHIYSATLLNFIQRRFTALEEKTVKVYPSFLQLRKFQIKAIPDLQASSGGRRQFQRGMSTEFDHIKEYTRGDDARTINWKASARKNELMINSFMDEKSQQIYCLIDKGRLMKMPFNNLTLLDYSINATLMFSYVALQKDDKIGLITFGEKVNDVLQPSKAKKQFNFVMELLYKQETRFLESNYAELYHVVNKRCGHRSLLLLFTNFETLTGFERQLPYLKIMNQKHVLCVVLFENTEVTNIHTQRGDSIEDIYIKTIADKFIYEKKMIIKELQKNGILVVYTQPSKLTVDVVNKYLELKARQFI